LEITTLYDVRSATQFALCNFGENQAGTPATSASDLQAHITFDRCYLHGTTTGNLRRAIAGNALYLAVVDSYINECHEVGADNQTIACWNRTGPFKIDNNYLSAAGENVIFGGSDPSIVNASPADATITRNYLFKPLSWNVDDPSYAGINWQVKNILEFKHMLRALVEGN